jgi:hypothetical protein
MMYPVLARMMFALPFVVAEQLVRQQTGRTNFVCTNVPGPARTCYLAGGAIERIYAFAPLVGDHPVAIALYSYREVMCVGLDVDSFAMHDLAHFRDALQEAYDEVLHVGRHAQVMPRLQRARRRKGTRKVA